MNERNEHFTMILDVLKQLQIKPNKQSLNYADKFIQSNGGYMKYFDSYKQYKSQKTRTAFVSPMITPQMTKDDTKLVEKQQNNDEAPKSNKIRPPKPPAYQPKKLELNVGECDVESPKPSPALVHTKHQWCSTPPPLPTTLPSSEPQPTRIQKQPQQEAENRSPKDARGALLNSIVNFKGKLRKTDVAAVSNTQAKMSAEKDSSSTKTSKFANEQNNIINQLFLALDEMRPYLSKSINNNSLLLIICISDLFILKKITALIQNITWPKIITLE